MVNNPDFIFFTKNKAIPFVSNSSINIIERILSTPNDTLKGILISVTV